MPEEPTFTLTCSLFFEIIICAIESLGCIKSCNLQSSITVPSKSYEREGIPEKLGVNYCNIQAPVGSKVFSNYLIDTTVSKVITVLDALRCVALIETAVFNTVLYAKFWFLRRI